MGTATIYTCKEHHSFCHETLVESYIDAVLQNTTTLPLYYTLNLRELVWHRRFATVYDRGSTRCFEIRIYYRKLIYHALTRIVSICDVSSYPTYEKSPLTRNFTTYDRTYEIATLHQNYEKSSVYIKNNSVESGRVGSIPYIFQLREHTVNISTSV